MELVSREFGLGCQLAASFAPNSPNCECVNLPSPSGPRAKSLELQDTPTSYLQIEAHSPKRSVSSPFYRRGGSAFLRSTHRQKLSRQNFEQLPIVLPPAGCTRPRLRTTAPWVLRFLKCTRHFCSSRLAGQNASSVSGWHFRRAPPLPPICGCALKGPQPVLRWQNAGSGPPPPPRIPAPC